MEAQITVRSLSSGRVLARIEPLGPEVQADSVEDAVVAAQSAHQWYLRQQTRWFPPSLQREPVRYSVIQLS
jgi:hypothetical protein